MTGKVFYYNRIKEQSIHTKHMGKHTTNRRESNGESDSGRVVFTKSWRLRSMEVGERKWPVFPREKEKTLK